MGEELTKKAWLLSLTKFNRDSAGKGYYTTPLSSLPKGTTVNMIVSSGAFRGGDVIHGEGCNPGALFEVVQVDDRHQYSQYDPDEMCSIRVRAINDISERDLLVLARLPLIKLVCPYTEEFTQDLLQCLKDGKVIDDNTAISKGESLTIAFDLPKRNIVVGDIILNPEYPEYLLRITKIIGVLREEYDGKFSVLYEAESLSDINEKAPIIFRDKATFLVRPSQ